MLGRKKVLFSKFPIMQNIGLFLWQKKAFSKILCHISVFQLACINIFEERNGPCSWKSHIKFIHSFKPWKTRREVIILPERLYMFLLIKTKPLSTYINALWCQGSPSLVYDICKPFEITFIAKECLTQFTQLLIHKISNLLTTPIRSRVSKSLAFIAVQNCLKNNILTIHCFSSSRMPLTTTKPWCLQYLSLDGKKRKKKGVTMYRIAIVCQYHIINKWESP